MKAEALLKDLVLIPALAAILFVQQIALAFIPNVQLTVILVVLYTKVIGVRKTTIVVLLHLIAYNFLSPLGPMLITHFPFAVIAWLLLIVVTKIVKDNVYVLSVVGLIFGFVYGWILAIPAVLISNAPLWAYLLSDIPFEIIMAISNFVTILWLYERLKTPLATIIEDFYKEVE